MLTNDKGQTEEETCKNIGPDFCSWDDVQSWSRELYKRRERAWTTLRIKPRDEWPASWLELESWSNGAFVVDNSKLSDQTMGIPSQEKIELIIGQIKDGDRYLRNAGAALAGPQAGESTFFDFEIGDLFKWAAGIGVGFLAFRALTDRGGK